MTPLLARALISPSFARQASGSRNDRSNIPHCRSTRRKADPSGVSSHADLRSPDSVTMHDSGSTSSLVCSFGMPGSSTWRTICKRQRMSQDNTARGHKPRWVSLGRRTEVAMCGEQSFGQTGAQSPCFRSPAQLELLWIQKAQVQQQQKPGRLKKRQAPRCSPPCPSVLCLP